MLFTLLAAAGASAYFLWAGPFHRYRYAAAAGMAITGLVIFYLLFYRNLMHISVNDEGVRFRHVFGRKTDFVSYDDILKIKMDMFQIENLNGPLTEPVPEIELQTARKGSYYIFSGVYANFYPLIKKILEGYNRSLDKRTDILAEKIFRQFLNQYTHGQRKQKTTD